jgi:hypothetical protein
MLAEASAELYEDYPELMSTSALKPTKNPIEDGDLELFFEGIDHDLISLHRGGKFNTADRPKPAGHWSLLCRSRDGGWYNAEYLPQLAAYVELITRLEYPKERVLFELPGRALNLDLAVLDDDNRVVVLGEAKRSVPMLEKLLLSMADRFVALPPSPETKKRGDEARQLAWRLWTVKPSYILLAGPGVRRGYECTVAPLHLTRLADLPRATALGLDRRPPRPLAPPTLS